MKFPADHWEHPETQIEWFYAFGRLSNDEFFHLASFRFKLGGFRNRATQWSIHNKESRYFEELADDFDEMKWGLTYMPKGNRFNIECKEFYLTMFPNSKAMIHESTKDRHYYSIPSLTAEGLWKPDSTIKCDCWLDHEFTDYKKFSDWDWIGVKLDCGFYIMVHDSETDKRCDIQFNDKMMKSDFTLEGKELSVHSLGMRLILEPTVEEKVFDPKFGIPYSEVPCVVHNDGRILGTAFRERTYRRREQNGLVCRSDEVSG